MLVLQKKCYDCRLFLFEHLATKINIEKTESNIVKCVNYLCLNLFIKMPFFSSRNFLNMFCLIAPRQRQILAQFACRLTCLLHVCQSVSKPVMLDFCPVIFTHRKVTIYKNAFNMSDMSDTFHEALLCFPVVICV